MDFNSLRLAARFAGLPCVVRCARAGVTGGCASYLQVDCGHTRKLSKMHSMSYQPNLTNCLYHSVISCYLWDTVRPSGYSYAPIQQARHVGRLRIIYHFRRTHRGCQLCSQLTHLGFSHPSNCLVCNTGCSTDPNQQERTFSILSFQVAMAWRACWRMRK